MKQRPTGRPSSSERIIRDIKRKTRKQYSAEEKIRIVLDGLRGGRSAGLAATAGVFVGCLRHILFAVVGLSALIAASNPTKARLRCLAARMPVSNSSLIISTSRLRPWV
jgi:transposase-like protein